MHTPTFKPELLDFRGANSKGELATFVAGCFKTPCVFAGVGLVTEGLFNDDDGLDGGGLVREGFLSPVVDGCLNAVEALVGFLRSVVSCGLLLIGDCGGGGVETEDGCFSPMVVDGCFKEDGGDNNSLADFSDMPGSLEGREVPPGDVKTLFPGIPLEPGFRKPLILEAPVEGGMIPEFGALIASSTFGSSNSSVS